MYTSEIATQFLTCIYMASGQSKLLFSSYLFLDMYMYNFKNLVVSPDLHIHGIDSAPQYPTLYIQRWGKSEFTVAHLTASEETLFPDAHLV